MPPYVVSERTFLLRLDALRYRPLPLIDPTLQNGTRLERQNFP